jgi:hypothetical protein
MAIEETLKQSRQKYRQGFLLGQASAIDTQRTSLQINELDHRPIDGERFLSIISQASPPPDGRREALR